MTDLATADEVKTRLGGDVPKMSDSFDAVIAAKVTEISADIERMVKIGRGIRGDWSFVADTMASVRQSVGRGGVFLPIDDCIEITRVALLNLDGAEQDVLTAPGDYLLEPLSGLPIIGLTSRQGPWAAGQLVAVTAKWGYGVAVPVDAREATIIEVIRSYLADRVGNDDRLGLTPFGSVTVARAFTSKVKQLCTDYSMGGGFLR
jgi:hypothetical protein